MKKLVLVYFCLIFTVLLSSFVYCAENDGAPLKDSDILSKEVNLPDFFKEISDFLFGYDSSISSNLAEFMVYFSLWIILYVLLANILMFIARATNLSFLGGSWKSWVGSLFLTYFLVQYLFVDEGLVFLASFIGNFFSYLFSLFDLFDILEATIYILLIILITFFISSFITIMQKKIKLKRAYNLGFQVGSGRY